jgi:L-2-hydroxycarboxylate dehydrogenase (NAD+)
MATETRQRFDPEKLTIFAQKVLRKIGMPEEDARLTGKMLIACDLRGVESHGIAHLQLYSNWMKSGSCNMNPKITISDLSPTTATMDGDNSLGFVNGHKAMTEAIKRAEKHGTGFVTVRNSKHYGAATYYAMMALEHDMIGISMTAGGRMLVAPGSTGRAGGLNPIAVAVPAGKKHPFVLDMSTSVVAGGKIEIAKRQGKMIPEGWMVNGDGKPITDPSTVEYQDPSFKGGILPLGSTPALGSYKGFGLSVLVDILCTTLSGAAPGTMANHFFGAIRINGFRAIQEFKKDMDQLIESIESLPPLPGVNKVYATGGLEAEIVAERSKNGIPLDNAVIQQLKDLSRETGVEYDIER